MRRKVFRIEAMLAPQRPTAPAAPARQARPASPAAKPVAKSEAKPADGDGTEALHSLKAELTFIRDAIARNKHELTMLIGEGKDQRFARAADELGAAVDGMRGATDTILSRAETADDNARTLAASLKDDYKRGLAQDIQDQIVKIYEACNFQDIAGQHIGKVIKMLETTEQQLAAILGRCKGVDAATQPLIAMAPMDDNGLLNGPKVAGDDGHATQHDIDRLFI